MSAAQTVNEAVPLTALDRLIAAQKAIPVVLQQVAARLQREFPSELPFGYQPLDERVGRILRGENEFGGAAQHPHLEMEALVLDLQAMLDCPADQLRRMVRNRSATSNCYPPGYALEQHRAHMAAITTQHRQPQNPRVSPAELVQRFAARGVMIRSVGGDLHVSPVELLGDADRAVLREHKAGILEALARPAEVV